MNNRSQIYPYVQITNVLPADEQDFIGRIRLYGKALAFLYATEFAGIHGSDPLEREANRREWFARHVRALSQLCAVSCDHDERLIEQPIRHDPDRSAMRWACGVATLTSLVVEPQVQIAFAPIQEHCHHLNRFFGGRDLAVTFFDDTIRNDANKQRGSLQYSLRSLRSTPLPLVTPERAEALMRARVTYHRHVLGMLQPARSGSLQEDDIPVYRRHLAAVAVEERHNVDSPEFLAAALHGDDAAIRALCQSLRTGASHTK